MEIKPQQLEKFIEIYEQDVGIKLTKSEAHNKALLLLNLALICIKPLDKNNEDDINNVRNENSYPL